MNNFNFPLNCHFHSQVRATKIDQYEIPIENSPIKDYEQMEETTLNTNTTSNFDWRENSAFPLCNSYEWASDNQEHDGISNLTNCFLDIHNQSNIEIEKIIQGELDYSEYCNPLTPLLTIRDFEEIDCRDNLKPSPDHSDIEGERECINSMITKNDSALNDDVSMNNSIMDTEKKENETVSNEKLTQEMNQPYNSSRLPKEKPSCNTKKCCTCKKSQCLKLYCECFSSQGYCSGCSCVNCHNIPEYEDERTLSISKITKKKQSKFAKQLLCEEIIDSCNCKKSMCQRNYCYCFKNGKKCNKLCKCDQCDNHITKEEIDGLTMQS